MDDLTHDASASAEAGQPPSSRKKTFLILGLALALLFLAGAGAFVCFGIFFSPERAIEKAFRVHAQLTSASIHTDTFITVEGEIAKALKASLADSDAPVDEDGLSFSRSHLLGILQDQQFQPFLSQVQTAGLMVTTDMQTNFLLGEAARENIRVALRSGIMDGDDGSVPLRLDVETRLVGEDGYVRLNELSLGGNFAKAAESTELPFEALTEALQGKWIELPAIPSQRFPSLPSKEEREGLALFLKEAVKSGDIAFVRLPSVWSERAVDLQITGGNEHISALLKKIEDEGGDLHGYGEKIQKAFDFFAYTKTTRLTFVFDRKTGLLKYASFSGVLVEWSERGRGEEMGGKILFTHTVALSDYNKPLDIEEPEEYENIFGVLFSLILSGVDLSDFSSLASDLFDGASASPLSSDFFSETDEDGYDFFFAPPGDAEAEEEQLEDFFGSTGDEGEAPTEVQLSL